MPNLPRLSPPPLLTQRTHTRYFLTQNMIDWKRSLPHRVVSVLEGENSNWHINHNSCKTKNVSLHCWNHNLITSHECPNCCHQVNSDHHYSPSQSSFGTQTNQLHNTRLVFTITHSLRSRWKSYTQSMLSNNLTSFLNQPAILGYSIHNWLVSQSFI